MAKNRFVHVELSTNAPEKAVTFYKKIFKWKMMPMTGMPYTMIDTSSKESGAGIQKKQMPKAPTMWLPYVEVDSVKKTVAKARQLGARIHLPYMPIPGMGAMGVFEDPSGGTIGVWESGKKPRKAHSNRK